MSQFLKNIAAVELEVDKPQRMIIVGFDRQPLADTDGNVNYIDIHSFDSEIGRKHDRAIRNRRLNMRGRGKITAEIVDAEVIDLFVAITAGWGTISKDGAATPDPDFSKEAARALYAEPRNSEIRAQVDEFASERANFSKASPKT